MPRNSPTTTGDIVELARLRLGEGSSLHYAPSIPPDKEETARAIHGRHLPESEPILVLHDNTVFGSAKDGFVVTRARLCWKNILQHPRQIEWGDVDPESIRPDGGHVAVAGGEVGVSSELVATAALFFRDLASRRRAGDTGPYRDARADSEGVDGAALGASRILGLARRHVGEVEDTYYHPAIPAAKLRLARATHARHLPEDEIAVMLYDDTVFGSAEEGFLITPRRLCWKDLNTAPQQCEWHDLSPTEISVSGNAVHVVGGALVFTARSELVGPVARLLAAIASAARRATRP